MRTFKLLMLALAYAMACSAAKAADPPASRLTRKYVIDAYVNAMTRGKITGIDDALDQNAKFGMLRNKHIENFGKPDMMDYFRSNQGIQQNCVTRIDTFENNADMALVKVDMHYNNFVRSNYITVVNTAGGWKITNVYSLVK